MAATGAISVKIAGTNAYAVTPTLMATVRKESSR